MQPLETGPLIYLVEGDAEIRGFIEGVLEGEGLGLEIAETVEEIYSVLGQLTPALVIVDLSPAETVEEIILFEALKKKNVPSLALDWSLSPNSGPEEIKKRRELLGVTAVIPKPFEIESLVGAVRHLTNSANSQKDKLPLPVPPRQEPE